MKSPFRSPFRVYESGKFEDKRARYASNIKPTVVYRRFLPYLRPYWLQICLLLVMLVGQILTDVLKPWPMKFAFDNVIGQRPVDGLLGRMVHALVGADPLGLLNLIVLSYLGLVILDGLFSYASVRLLASIGNRAMFDIRQDLFSHLQHLSLRFHGSHKTGDLISRVTGDVSNVNDMIVTATSTVFVNVLTIVFMLLIMLRLDWQYTLLALLIVPVMILVVRRHLGASRQAAMQVRGYEGQVSSIVQEVISSIRVVKAFAREDYEQQRFEAQSGASLQANLHMGKLQAQFSRIIQIVGSVSTLLLLWVGVRNVLAGSLSAGELIIFISYLRSIYGPLRQLSRASNTMARGSAGAERILEILNAEPDLQDLPHARPAPRLKGHVLFDRVSFGYDPARPVLHEVSFEAEPGSVVALVGATGSGKTTTVSMIPRFYDPTAGAVRVDGRDVRDYTLRSLRSQVSLVLQEPVLFQASIFENVAYGKPDATMAEVHAALEAANALEFVGQLPQGGETIVGERGATLSGGQRQRIAIARAVVRDAPILILDEPTVGLDPETEATVLEALERLRLHRTTFVIAHHLTTVHGADKIIVLDGGRVIETGKHQELMQKNGRYARLYRAQDTSLGSLAKELRTSA